MTALRRAILPLSLARRGECGGSRLRRVAFRYRAGDRGPAPIRAPACGAIFPRPEAFRFARRRAAEFRLTLTRVIGRWRLRLRNRRARGERLGGRREIPNEYCRESFRACGLE